MIIGRKCIFDIPGVGRDEGTVINYFYDQEKHDVFVLLETSKNGALKVVPRTAVRLFTSED